jgi:hypothetical protein
MMSAAPMARPATTGFVDDATTGSRCHWERNQDEDLCIEVLLAVATSWEVQVTEGGWPTPFTDAQKGGSDGVDFYLSTVAEFGAYTWSNYQDFDPEDGRFASNSYVVIDPRVRGLHLFVAHEFNHVLQFAVDTTEPSYVPWEAAATLAEEQTFPGEGSLADVAPDFQKTPWESVLGDGTHLWEEFQIWSFYEYGSSLWMAHLFQEWGVEPVDLWWAMINDTWQNEPDVWDAVHALTGDADASLVSFSVARGRIGRDDADDWLQAINAPVRIQGKLVELDKPVSPKQEIQDLGVAFFDVEIEGRYVLLHDADPETRWRIVDVDTGDELSEDSVLEGPHRVAWVNVGPEDLDIDAHCDGYCAFPGRSLSVWAEVAPLLDDDDDEDEGEPPVEAAACACSSNGSIASGWALLGVLLLGFRRSS